MQQQLSKTKIIKVNRDIKIKISILLDEYQSGNMGGNCGSVIDTNWKISTTCKSKNCNGELVENFYYGDKTLTGKHSRKAPKRISHICQECFKEQAPIVIETKSLFSSKELTKINEDSGKYKINKLKQIEQFLYNISFVTANNVQCRIATDEDIVKAKKVLKELQDSVNNFNFRGYFPEQSCSLIRLTTNGKLSTFEEIEQSCNDNISRIKNTFELVDQETTFNNVLKIITSGIKDVKIKPLNSKQKEKIQGMFEQ